MVNHPFIHWILFWVGGAYFHRLVIKVSGPTRRQSCTVTLTAKVNLESAITLTCKVDFRKVLENPETPPVNAYGKQQTQSMNCICSYKLMGLWCVTKQLIFVRARATELNLHRCIVNLKICSLNPQYFIELAIGCNKIHYVKKKKKLIVMTLPYLNLRIKKRTCLWQIFN